MACLSRERAHTLLDGGWRRAVRESVLEVRRSHRELPCMRAREAHQRFATCDVAGDEPPLARERVDSLPILLEGVLVHRAAVATDQRKAGGEKDDGTRGLLLSPRPRRGIVRARRNTSTKAAPGASSNTSSTYHE